MAFLRLCYWRYAAQMMSLMTNMKAQKSAPAVYEDRATCMYIVDNEYVFKRRLARLGESSDRASQAGRYDEALHGYESILTQMRQRQCMDTFFLSKLILGKLITLIRAKQSFRAYSLWAAYRCEDEANSVCQGTGLWASDQMSVRDQIIYLSVSGFFYSLSSDVTAAVQQVNRCLQTAWQHNCAYQLGLEPQVLSNWHQCLQRLMTTSPHDGTELQVFWVPYRQAASHYGPAIAVSKEQFPLPAYWVADWRYLERTPEPPEAIQEPVGPSQMATEPLGNMPQL
ncbi:MAG: hypothetical protein AAFW75_15535 [Cyanobacteria bacterium J06636_16]